MNTRNTLVFLAAAAVAVVVVKKFAGRSETASGGSPDNSRVAHLVEETLHQHEGEDNPVVHAFEAALEH